MSISWFLNYQTITASIIGIGVSILTTWLNNQYQRNRENERWYREKLYEAYSAAIAASSMLVRYAQAPAFYGEERASKQAEFLLNFDVSRNTLSILCSEEYREKINQSWAGIEEKVAGHLINPPLAPALRQVTQELISLMQSDPRLKGLRK